GDGIDDRARWILSGVKRVEPDHVVDDAPFCQLVYGRGIGVVVAEEMYANPDFLENRIVERCDLKSLAFGIHKDIRRPVVRRRGPNQIVAGRHADYDVATPLLQGGVHGVSDEPPALSPPDVAGGRVQVSGDHVSDLVLEALQLSVGKGEILRIGAHTELLFFLPER